MKRLEVQSVGLASATKRSYEWWSEARCRRTAFHAAGLEIRGLDSWEKHLGSGLEGLGLGFGLDLEFS